MDRVKRGNWLIALSLLLFSNMALADWSGLNMRKGVTQISHEVYELHMVVLVICTLIGIVVFGTMIFSMLMHRKSMGAVPATFHENTKLEIIWTIIPIIILVALAVPSTSTLRSMYESGESDVDIQIRGFQWKWQYTYLDDDPAKEVQFMSALLTPEDEIYNRANKRENYLLDVDKELVIPINKRIRFLITSNDVIHAWWVPDFAVKKDAIPGFVHEAWTVVDEPGIYRGQCAELCGKDHGFMPIVVRAVEEPEYELWLAEQRREAEAAHETVGKTWTMDELMESGEQVYNQNCMACHQANGQGIPPAFPSLVGSPLIKGPIADHTDMVVNGKAGTAMQAFGVQLNPAQIAAVITFERNAWGNNSGEMIQPSEINNLLSGQ
jgi:cytochrome c oxidase subunit II